MLNVNWWIVYYYNMGPRHLSKLLHSHAQEIPPLKNGKETPNVISISGSQEFLNIVNHNSNKIYEAPYCQLILRQHRSIHTIETGPRQVLPHWPFTNHWNIRIKWTPTSINWLHLRLQFLNPNQTNLRTPGPRSQQTHCNRIFDFLTHGPWSVRLVTKQPPRSFSTWCPTKDTFPHPYCTPDTLTTMQPNSVQTPFTGLQRTPK